MPEKKLFKVLWTENAFKNAAEIKNYLNTNFTNIEVISFYNLLSAFEFAISVYPKIYPTTKKQPKIHRAVLNKYLSVFYRVRKSSVEIIAVLDNRSNLKNWL